MYRVGQKNGNILIHLNLIKILTDLQNFLIIRIKLEENFNNIIANDHTVYLKCVTTLRCKMSAFH